MRTPAPVGMCVASLALALVGCQSMSGTPYRANSVQLFTPERLARVSDSGVTLLVGRLTEESAVVRVLGDRSRKLAAMANILQVNVSSETHEIEMSRQSFRLRLPSGEMLAPLLPHQVLAAVSLPAEYWTQAPSPPLERRTTLSGTPVEDAMQLSGSETAFLGAAATAIDLAIEKAGAKKYREAARADVEQKTTLDRTIAARETASFLVAFAPRSGKIQADAPLDITVEFLVDGAPWAKMLTVPAS